MQIHICHLNQLFLICLLFLFGNWVSLKIKLAVGFGIALVSLGTWTRKYYLIKLICLEHISDVVRYVHYG